MKTRRLSFRTDAGCYLSFPIAFSPRRPNRATEVVPPGLRTDFQSTISNITARQVFKEPSSRRDWRQNWFVGQGARYCVPTRRRVELRGFEPLTYGLQSRRSPS